MADLQGWIERDVASVWHGFTQMSAYASNRPVIVERAEGRELIDVEFVANEFFFVYVRVNGRKLTLEPRDSVKLPPGSHRVQLRQSPDEKWQSAGRIKIEAGSTYRVEMKQPAGLKLVTK